MGQVNYSASKAGVEGLTRTAAKELSKCVSILLTPHCYSNIFTDLQTFYSLEFVVLLMS